VAAHLKAQAKSPQVQPKAHSLPLTQVPSLAQAWSCAAQVVSMHSHTSGQPLLSQSEAALEALPPPPLPLNAEAVVSGEAELADAVDVAFPAEAAAAAASCSSLRF